MHGFFIPTSWVIGSLAAGLALLLSAFGLAFFTKGARQRGPTKLVLDGLSLLLGATGLLVTLASAGASYFAGSNALIVPSVFAVLAVLAFVTSFLAYGKARSLGNIGALGWGVLAIFAWIAGAVALLIAAVSIAAAWGGA